MDFSESYRCSLPPVFSPDGAYLAAAVEYRLVIREVETLKVVQIYSCLDKIHRLEHVLCGLYDRATVQVFSVDDVEWACRIDEGPAGVSYCRWGPDGLSVLIVADFCVRMTAWSLMDRRCTYLPGPKHASKGLAPDPDSGAMAVLERKEGRDWVAVYDVGGGGDGWALRNRFQLDTVDAADLAWSPDGARIAIWDSPLAYKERPGMAGVAVHAADDGSPLGSFSAYDDALGVKAASWAPGGLLAVGSYDQVARVLNPVTWRPLLECHHGSPVDAPGVVAVYREVEERRGPLPPVQAPPGGKDALAGSPARREVQSRYAVCPLPAEITSVTPPKDKPNPKLGVGTLAWSPDGRLLATINGNMPSAAWVWDARGGELVAVLAQLSAVRGLAWSPSGESLAVVAGGGRLYLWSPAGASIVHVPVGGFQAHGVSWAQGGAVLALWGKDSFCCGYVGT